MSESKIVITGIEVEDLVNEGCNNGNYPKVQIGIDFGTGKSTSITGKTCRCRRGCANTWRVDDIVVGSVFDNIHHLYEYLED